MYEDILEEVLFSKDQLAMRIKEMATELDKDYAGKKPLMVAILKGSVMFFTDLIRVYLLKSILCQFQVTATGSSHRAKLR